MVISNLCGEFKGVKGIALVIKAQANLKQKYFGHIKNMESFNKKNING